MPDKDMFETGRYWMRRSWGDSFYNKMAEASEAEGEFYLSIYCHLFPPMWIDLEGTWTATYNLEE